MTDNLDSSNILGYDLYIRLFLYIILIICVLIQNEIIVINICGLASDTKYFLNLKLKNENYIQLLMNQKYYKDLKLLN